MPTKTGQSPKSDRRKSKRKEKHHEDDHHHREEKQDSIDLLTPKQNGSVVEEQPGKTSIRGMWKKAFKSIRHKDKHDKEKEKPEKERESEERPDKVEGSDRKYSRQSSRQSSLKKILRRKDSSEQRDPRDREGREGSIPNAAGGAVGGPEGSFEESEELDPVFATLKQARSFYKSGKSGSGDDPEHDDDFDMGSLSLDYKP